MNKHWMKMVIGIVLLTIAFVMFPVVLDGTTSITSHAHVNSFTGLLDVAQIGPLVIFVGLNFGSIFSSYLGVRGMMGRS